MMNCFSNIEWKRILVSQKLWNCPPVARLKDLLLSGSQFKRITLEGCVLETAQLTSHGNWYQGCIWLINSAGNKRKSNERFFFFNVFASMVTFGKPFRKCLRSAESPLCYTCEQAKLVLYGRTYDCLFCHVYR